LRTFVFLVANGIMPEYGYSFILSTHKRRYPAHFVSKLTDADGELQETRHWIGRALAYEYLTASAFDRLKKRCDKIGNMLGKMIQSPDSFTGTAA